jgi:hypothetical protein
LERSDWRKLTPNRVGSTMSGFKVWLQNIFKTVSDLSEDLAEHGDSDAAPAVNAKGRTSANHKVVS